MDGFKFFAGGFLVRAGAIFGLYVGIWICFIGGIAAFIEAIQVDTVIPMDIAISIGRVWFSTLIGWFSAVILIYPGLKLMK